MLPSLSLQCRQIQIHSGAHPQEVLYAQMYAKYPAPEAYKVALAGNNLFMPGSQQEIDNLTAALKNGHITREELIKNATRICRMAVELAGASV